MDDKEFEQIMQTLQEYLEKEKTFVINPFRMKEFKRAVEIANELFYDHKTEIKDDPIQMGAEIIRIEGMDILMRGEREINLFCEMVALADNFEIYSTSENSIRFAAVFQNVLSKIN